jgi:hypothetical protein
MSSVVRYGDTRKNFVESQKGAKVGDDGKVNDLAL